MASEMIERVARIIDSQAWNASLNVMWRDGAIDQRQAAAMDTARAAIEAMREPTDAMATHPMATCYNYGPYGDKEVRRIWRSMIDAALNAESVPLMPVYGSREVEEK